MLRSDLPRLVKLLERLCAVWNRKCSQELVEGYFVALADVEIDAVEQHALLLLRTSRWMPAPAELRSGPLAPPEARAALAWAELRGRIAAVASGRDEGKIADEAAQSAWSALGGWHALGQRERGQLDFVRNDFVALHAAFSATQAVEKARRAIASESSRPVAEQVAF